MGDGGLSPWEHNDDDDDDDDLVKLGAAIKSQPVRLSACSSH